MNDSSLADKTVYRKAYLVIKTIRPHPKWKGGYLAETVDGLTIGLRPGSQAGGPVIDLHKLFEAGKSRWEKVHFKP
jgi:hypothetical protein